MTDVRENRHVTGTGVTATGVAAKLAAILEPVVGGDLPVRLRAWDGSEAGSPDGPLVVLNSADAVRRLLWRPGELGAAQAYVTGELDVPAVDGWDLDKALTYVWDVVAQRGLSGGRPLGRRDRAARSARWPASACSAPRRRRRRPRPRSRAGCTASCATAARSASTTTSPTSSTR